MSDNTTAAPAGASEQASAPAQIGPMSESAAAALFADWDNAPETPAEAAPGAADSTNIESDTSGDAAATAGDNPEEPAAPAGDDADPAVTAETDAQPDASEDGEQYVHGNARTRLRDGTVTTVAELKKLADEAREFRAKGPEITAAQEQLKQFQDRAAQLAQQEQLYNQLVPLAAQRLQAQIPPAPDAELLNPQSPKYDPFAHYEQTSRHNAALGELQQFQHSLQQQQTLQQQQAEQARAAQLQQVIADNRKALVEKIPALADPEKVPQFYDSFLKTTSKYGFNKQDVDSVYDNRVFHMVHDMSVQIRDLTAKAAAYDKLMAQKPAVAAKAKTAVPVQQPGRRVSEAETSSQADAEQVQRARQRGGQIQDMAALFAKF